MDSKDRPDAEREVLALAVEVAVHAGDLARRLFFEAGSVRYKPDGTEVTDADVAVEEAVASLLARYAPDDAVLGEERGASKSRSTRRWIVDPISGTGYFTRRMPLFANLIAYEDEHGPAVGVINMPIQRELVFAARGMGCHIVQGDAISIAQGRRAHIQERADATGALALTANQHTFPDALLLALHQKAILAGAVHHGVVHLVAGRVDAVIMGAQGYEDLAPLPVIVEEAGGRLTDLVGRPVLEGNGSALAASAGVHADLVALTAHLPQPSQTKALRQEAAQ